MLVREQGFPLKQQGKIYQCYVGPILLYCCERWKLTVADEARLHGVYHTHEILILTQKIMKPNLKEISHILKDTFDFVERTEKDLEIGTVGVGVADIKSL